MSDPDRAMIASLLLAALLADAPPAGAVVLQQGLVELAAGRLHVDVTLRNDDTAPREVRARALSWAQDERGQVTLSPADAVGVFPPRALLAPGEERRLRIFTLAPPGDAEAAYRVALDLRDPGTGEALTTLVPVFVSPDRRVRSASVRAECEARRCTVVLRNRGNVALWPDRIVVAARARDGAGPAWDLEPWWVLAGGSRAYEVALPAGAQAEALDVRVTLGPTVLAASAALTAEKETP